LVDRVATQTLPSVTAATGGVMTYSPGSPGYPPPQPGGSYPGATPSFAKTDDVESKLPLYLDIAVVGLGLAVYLLNFGPIFTFCADLGPGAGGRAGDAGIAVAISVLAALLAGLGLLPKGKSYVGIVAAVAALGALLAIAETISTPTGVSVGWALWPLLASSVLQALAAVVAVLLDAGVITAPTPRPKYDPYAQFGQYGQYGQYGGQQPGYYGQPSAQQHAGPQSHNPQPSGYGAQYGGYPSSQSPTQAAVPTQSAGFNAQSGPQPAVQEGPNTPPTGFPSFSPPPSVHAGAGSEGAPASVNYSSPTGGQQQPLGQGQQSPSSPAGPAPA
jgi:hypothetical protein